MLREEGLIRERESIVELRINFGCAVPAPEFPHTTYPPSHSTASFSKCTAQTPNGQVLRQGVRAAAQPSSNSRNGSIAYLVVSDRGGGICFSTVFAEPRRPAGARRQTIGPGAGRPERISWHGPEIGCNGTKFLTAVCIAAVMIHDGRVNGRTRDIIGMPRGGLDASWLDRRLQTDRLEYLDRDDANDLKRKVMHSLDRAGRRRWTGIHEKCARMALREVADIPSPKILELGAGLGGLSRKLLEKHPTAQLTVTDIDNSFVAGMAAGDLGSHPRVTVRQMDATEIDAPDGYYDLAVFALSLHHLPPELATQVFAAGTRAAKKLLIVDLPRPPAPVHVALLAVVWPLTRLSPLQHDGFISSLRAYSQSAMRALADHADPAITVEFRTRRGLAPTVAVASRGPAGRQSSL